MFTIMLYQFSFEQHSARVLGERTVNAEAIKVEFCPISFDIWIQVLNSLKSLSTVVGGHGSGARAGCSALAPEDWQFEPHPFRQSVQVYLVKIMNLKLPRET